MSALLHGVAVALGWFAAADVTSMIVSPPRTICTLDRSVLQGEVGRLSWSADNTRVHVQTAERDALHDYIVTLSDGMVSTAFGEPEWAAEYWAKKSNLAAPGMADLRIEVIEDHQ